MTGNGHYLKELSETIGLSGNEDAVRAVVLRAIEGHADSIRIDPMGSVTAIKRGTGENPLRVMIAAHMDEVGFMVMGFDGDGLIRFTAIGGLEDRLLPGLRVRIGDQQVRGVVIWTPIHKNREQTVAKIASLRIDIGATSKDEAQGKIKRGDRIAFDSEFVELSDKVLRGKSFDDRVGCSLLIDVLRGDHAYPVDVLAAFTVQEEIGLRGAQVAARTLDPDAALVLEGTRANDVPNPLDEPDEANEPNPTTRMGAGPVLTVIDANMIAHPRLLAFARAAAESEGIPYQIKGRAVGGTDGGAIHVVNGGVPTTVISMPCRYIHTPSALLHRDDYEHGLRLIKAILNGLRRDVL
ncbi:MAG: M20/M25/M40 family metallo-hydrolase [bacterium]|nr:M20/M25/M40 family metallo-hydrolase [bacterium]